MRTIAFAFFVLSDARRVQPRGPAGDGIQHRSAGRRRRASATSPCMRASCRRQTRDEAVARQYGLERSDRVAMLLVSVRRDGEAALPASVKVDARVSDASGRRREAGRAAQGPRSMGWTTTSARSTSRRPTPCASMSW